MDPLHVGLRAAKGYRSNVPEAEALPSIVDSWRSDDLYPTLEEAVTPSYFAVNSTNMELYKSPIVDCAWDKVSVVRIYCSHAN